MSNFIGIDLGATFIKGALFDVNKLEISNITKYSSPQPKIISKKPLFLRFETNPNLYEKIIRKIISKYLQISNDVAGIVFSTQMHGMVLMDSKFNPLTNFIGWQDERLLEKSTDRSLIWADILHSRIRNVNSSSTGIKLKSGLMGSTLFWLKENKMLDKYKNAKALFLGDYIAIRLSKGEAVTDATNACSSGLFDVKENRWDVNILKKIGIDISYMPAIVTTGTKVGYVKTQKRKIPIFVSVGDLQSTVLGSFIKKRDICINIGTGSQISLVSTKFDTGDYDIRSYFDNEFLYTITHIPAGRALNVLVKFIAGIGNTVYDVNNKVDLWKKLSNLIESRKESNGLKSNITFFKNNFTGVISGNFTNITEDNWTVENMFVSALESIAGNFKIVYNRLQKGRNINKITFSGGLARKLPLLRNLIKEKLNKKSYLAPYKEETLTGLFIISLFIERGFKNIKEASLYCKKHHVKYR